MKNNLLRRYTDLPAILHLLDTKCITLLDPQSWDDKNDSYYINKYKENKNLINVLVLCFTESSETYHHWKVFTRNASGVCIVFNKMNLLNNFNEESKIRCLPVIYKTINDMRMDKLIDDELPFLKRYPYRDEKEFRIIYEDSL